MEGKKEDEPLVFYYSRERRLANASEAVRRLNDGGNRGRPSLFRTLTANRALAFLFLAIIMLSATALVTTYLVPSADQATFKGNELRLTAFRYEGATYVALKKTAKKSAYEGLAVLHIRIPGQERFLFSRELVFGAKPDEEFKFKIDGANERIEAVVETEGALTILKAKAQ